MAISRRDWDHHRWLQDCDDADEDAKPKKPFQHRQMPTSKCPKCKMVIRSRGRDVCLANGQTINDNTGLRDCAFETVEVTDGTE